MWQGLLFSAIFGLTLLPVSGEPSIIERERARRAAQTEEAQGELTRGDAAYEAQNYEDAVTSYARARDLLTESALTGELRAAATQRYAQASVERARQLAKGGRRDDAEKLLDTILSAGVLPSYAPAQQLKAQIFDPIHYNPALSAESVREVDLVRRLLYTAEGFVSLGQFDEALATYHEVLRVDPANHAARRAMESIQAQRADYFEAARDDTRATMLAQVAAGWETPVSPIIGGGDGLGPLLEDVGIGRSSAEKLRSSIVPVVDLSGASLSEAVDFLRQQSINLDPMELDESRRGISFVIDLGNRDSPLIQRIESTRLDLHLRNVPLREVLDYITSATGTKVRVDEHAVVILPEGAVSDEMTSRRWRVPPDFLSRESIARGNGDGELFGDAEPAKSLLGAKLNARQYLEKQGVTFPEGATAGFTSFDSTLVVRNTRSNIDFVDQIVDSIMGEEPVAVKVEVRFVNVAQDTLSELGFDWLLSSIGLNGDMFLGGGTVGNGTPINDFAVGYDPVTSGNRSGVKVEQQNSIDALIRAGSRSSTGATDQDSVRGPGVMALAGVWDDQVLAVLMRGMARSKSADWAKTETVLTRSGQIASVHSVREMIVPTEYEPPELPNNVGGGGFNDLGGGGGGGGMAFATPATPTAFEKRITGCTLEVEPLVDADRRYVQVSLKPVITTFDGFIDYGTPINGGTTSPMINLGGIGNPDVPVFTNSGSYGQVTANSILMPVFSVTRTNTNLEILDGSTIVLGGLVNEHHSKYQDKVPILGDIPLIGRFFTSDAESSYKNVLLIFVKVELLDPAGYRFSDR